MPWQALLLGLCPLVLESHMCDGEAPLRGV